MRLPFTAGLGEGARGGHHPQGAACPLRAQPQPPMMGSITNPAKKRPESIWTSAPNAAGFLQMFMVFFMLPFVLCCMQTATWQLSPARKAAQEAGLGCPGLTLTPLAAKRGKSPSCQAEDSVCLLVQGETGGKSRRQELSEVLSAMTLGNSLA